MSRLEEIAQFTAQSFVRQDGVEAALDPATVSMFLSMILDLIDAIKQCRESANDGTNTVNNPSLIERVNLRQRMMDNMGRREFRRIGRQAMQALMETGRNITVEDMSELYNEV